MFQIGAGANSKLQARVPYWNLPYYQGMDLVFDAQRGGFKNGAAFGNDLATLVQDGHSSAIYAPNAAGVYTPFVANTLVRTDLGLQTTPTRSNLNPFSDFSNAGWSLSNGATATYNDNLAPDGVTMLGSTLTDPLTSGDVFVGRSIGVANDNTTYTASVFFKKTVGVQTSFPALFASFIGGTTVQGAVIVNTTAGTINISGNPLSQSIESAGNYWRVSLTIANNTSGNTQGAIRVYPAWNSTGLATARDATAVGSVVAAWYQFEPGAFASAPILTTGFATTVNGNIEVIPGLGSQLATGVAGFVQVDLRSVTGGTVINFSDGSGLNNMILEVSGAAALRIIVRSGNVQQALVIANSLISAGIATIAFCSTSNFLNIRQVGQSAPSSVLSLSYPGLNRLGLGGTGNNTTGNNYQQTRKLALDFLAPGDDPAAKFNDVYAKAVLAAAA